MIFYMDCCTSRTGFLLNVLYLKVPWHELFVVQNVVLMLYRVMKIKQFYTFGSTTDENGYNDLFGSKYAVCWALNMCSTFFCWALNMCGTFSCWARKPPQSPTRTCATHISSPTKKHILHIITAQQPICLATIGHIGNIHQKKEEIM